MNEAGTSRPATALATNLAGISLRNPVILAAGTCGYLDEMADVLDLSRVGGLVGKSITRLARDGNPTWRIIETRAGMMNAIGLANMGVEAWTRDVGPRVKAAACPVIGSIAGYSIDDYVQVAAAMDAVDGLDAVEINVSCPNVAYGCEFGTDEKLLRELVSVLRPVLKRTRMFVKLSPVAVGQPGIVALARAAIEGQLSTGGGGGPAGGPNSRPGADAICLANTTPAMAIDVRTRRPQLANVTGGLSGPAVHPMAVKLVHDVYRGIAKATGTPIIGIGGVMRWEDAAEFILAGATAVQMGTALFADPRAPLRVVRGLEKWVRSQNCAMVGELVGGVRLE